MKNGSTEAEGSRLAVQGRWNIAAAAVSWGNEVKVDRRENSDDSSALTDDGSKVRHRGKGRRAEEKENFEN